MSGRHLPEVIVRRIYRTRQDVLRIDRRRDMVAALAAARRLRRVRTDMDTAEFVAELVSRGFPRPTPQRVALLRTVFVRATYPASVNANSLRDLNLFLRVIHGIALPRAQRSRVMANPYRRR